MKRKTGTSKLKYAVHNIVAGHQIPPLWP